MNDIVTDVKPEKRGAYVTVNGDERLWFDRGAWIERAYSQGDELDLVELKQWLLPRQYPLALDAAVRLLAVRARSERELRERLGERGYLEDAVDLAIYKLQKNGLQSDESFADEWARARVRKGLGKARVLAELRQKGVASELCERALAAVNDDEQSEAGETLAIKLLKRYQGYEPEAAMQKVLSALARRGYRFDEARDAVSRALERMENDE